MAQPAEKPRVGLLGLTLELYEQLAPGLRSAARIGSAARCCQPWPRRPTFISSARPFAAMTSRRSWRATRRRASTRW